MLLNLLYYSLHYITYQRRPAEDQRLFFANIALACYMCRCFQIQSQSSAGSTMQLFMSWMQFVV